MVSSVAPGGNSGRRADKSPDAKLLAVCAASTIGLENLLPSHMATITARKIANIAAPKVEKKTKKKTKVFIPQFNSDSAYYFIKQQVDFGPRVPNSIAHQNCYLYLKNKLSNYGASIIVQEDTVRRFDGEILNMKNIIGSFNVAQKNRILLCAHWDSRYIADQDTDRINDPIDGANDGGSGVGRRRDRTSEQW